jgi:flagellar basal-body rod modification protein FlgD
MSSISSITNSSGSALNSLGATTPTAKNTLTTQDFLQLLSTELQNQDPLQPMDDTAYLAQMAQFTSLQQVSTLSTTISQMSSNQQNLAASSYLGQMVTMNTGNNSTVSGVVTGVDLSGTTPSLMINGTSYPLTSLLSVSAAPSSTNAATPSTTTGTN